ncbi:MULTISPECIES: hypothetical protein [Paenibacillus]|uniref:hypothetical protein n=1 Tax=Paenibacillus TaxID=44249 RepID=UPI00117CAC5C|nr:hypothetical protein [Paenibacillus lautus]
MTQLIVKKINYIKDKLFLHTNYSDVDNRRMLHMILNRYTSEICLNFFYQWLSIAKEGSRRAVAPPWIQIEQMIEMSLPSLIFKLDSDTRKKASIIQVYRSKNVRELPELMCTIGSKQMKKEIRNMKSYTPSRVAMKVFDNSSQENISQRDYVNKYVAKFSF